MKYRYIATGLANPSDRLSDFSLMSSRKTGGFSDFIRVEIPNDIKIKRWSRDLYPITDSDVPLKDLNPKVTAKFNGKIKVDEELTDLWLKGKIEPNQFRENLESRGFRGHIRYGYLDQKQMDFIRQISLDGNHKKFGNSTLFLKKKTLRVLFHNQSTRNAMPNILMLLKRS